MDWPNTPGLERYLNSAKDHIRQGPNPTDSPPSEGLYFRLFSHAIDLTAEASKEIKTTLANNPVTNHGDFYKIILDNIRPLSTESAIPAVLCQNTRMRPPPRNFPWFWMDILIREPDWMGVATLLPSLRNTNTILWEASPPDTGRTLCLVALSPGHPVNLPEEATDQFPRGEPSTLRDILTWHGANPLWIPYQAQTP